METLETTFESKLKSRIERHFKNHHGPKFAVNKHDLIGYVGRNIKCARCEKNITPFITAFFCEENSEDGCTHTMYFCTEIEHDAYVIGGKPFAYDVAIDIARELGGKAGMIDFANWLFAEIKENSKIDISPYINVGSDDIELGDLPETLQGWEKQYVEEQFEFYRQELFNKLYESMVPKN